MRLLFEGSPQPGLSPQAAPCQACKGAYGMPPSLPRHVREHGRACKVPISAASQPECKCKCKCHRAFHDQINTCMLCLNGIQSTLVKSRFRGSPAYKRNSDFTKLNFPIRLSSGPPLRRSLRTDRQLNWQLRP